MGVDEDLLLAAFGVLMLAVAASMGIRQWRSGRRPPRSASVGVDDPIITFSPLLTCQCPRALKVLVAATAVGLLTGFLGVGGGFLVVPALVLALGLPVWYAAGTSLVVITLTSAAALAVRVGSGVQPDWAIVAVLTVVAAVAGAGGTLLASRMDPRRLSIAFTVLVLAVAVGTAGQAVPALV